MLACVAGIMSVSACGGLGNAAVANEHGPVVVGDIPGTFFIEPDDGVMPIVRAIDGAQRSIDMTMYLLTDREVISALERSAGRGVHTRVLLEEHPVGSGPGNRSIYRQLEQVGIAVKWSNPRFRLTHEKSLVIDDHEAFIMSLNLTYSAVTHNREYGFIDTDPADVQADEAIFQADWNRTTIVPVDPHLVVSPVNARQRLLALIGSARHSLLLEQEELDDQQIEQALIAAAKRGVRVQLILPVLKGEQSSHADAIREVEQGGVSVRGLAVLYLHAKMVLADSRILFIGSENFSTASLNDERELGILLANPDAIQRVEQTFARDWSASRPFA